MRWPGTQIGKNMPEKLTNPTPEQYENDPILALCHGV
jgi:hypothetical protein